MSADLWVSGCDLRVSEPMLENGVQRSLKSITMPLFCEGVTTLGLFSDGGNAAAAAAAAAAVDASGSCASVLTYREIPRSCTSRRSN